MRKIKKVIELYCNTSLSNRDIKRASQLPSSTVNDYIKRFKGSPLIFYELSDLSESEVYQKLFSDPVKQRGKTKPDFAKINRELRKKNITRQILWEEYKEQHSDGFEVNETIRMKIMT